MDQVPFIEKPSKGLRNLSGRKRELHYSLEFHQQNIPLLVSSLVLRSRNLGQIDIAIINSKKIIEVFEIKSSEQGSHLSFHQRQRLNSALLFLTLIFNLSGRIKVIK